MVRAGVKVGPIHLLAVRGHKSGQPRTNPEAVVEQNGKRYLVAAFGVVNWVRNLRAASWGNGSIKNRGLNASNEKFMYPYRFVLEADFPDEVDDAQQVHR
jgi:hypothetical protein